MIILQLLGMGGGTDGGGGGGGAAGADRVPVIYAALISQEPT